MYVRVSPKKMSIGWCQQRIDKWHNKLKVQIWHWHLKFKIWNFGYSLEDVKFGASRYDSKWQIKFDISFGFNQAYLFIYIFFVVGWGHMDLTSPLGMLLGFPIKFNYVFYWPINHMIQFTCSWKNNIVFSVLVKITIWLNSIREPR